MEFLVLGDDALDTLGGDPMAWQDATNQLICDLLVEPAEQQNQSNNLEDRITEE